MSQENYKDRYQQYLESDHWKQMRTGCFFRDGRRCLHCKSKQNLNAHHLRYRNLIDCYLSDVMTLCRRCHDAVHLHMERNRIPSNVLEFEDVLSVLRQLNFPPRIPSKKADKKLTNRQRWDNAWSELKGSFPPQGNGPFTITAPMMELLKSDAGGYVGAVIRSFGVKHPLKGDWAKHQVGKTITKEKLVFAWTNRNTKAMKLTHVERCAQKMQAKLERRRAKKERKRLRRELLAQNVVPVNFKAA